MDLHSHTTPIFFWGMGEWFFRSLWERGVWRRELGVPGGFSRQIQEVDLQTECWSHGQRHHPGSLAPSFFSVLSWTGRSWKPPGLAFFCGWVRWEKGPFLSRKGWRCRIRRNKFEVWSSYHKKPAKCGTKGWQGHWFIISFSTLKHFFSGGKLSLSSFFETVVCQLLFLEDIANFPSQPRPYPLEKTPCTSRCPKFRTWTRGNVPSAPGQLVFVFFWEMDGTRQGWMFGSPRISNQKHWMPRPEHLVKWSASLFVFFFSVVKESNVRGLWKILGRPNT